jgi:hypothetical protein
VRVKELEAEKRQLKRMHEKASLGEVGIKAVFKSYGALRVPGDLVRLLGRVSGLSIRPACQLVNLSAAADYQEENKL